MRKEKGLTLEILAEKLGTSRQTIHRYENGTISNIPPVITMAKMNTMYTIKINKLGSTS